MRLVIKVAEDVWIQITKFPSSIGSDPCNQIVLHDRTGMVSPHHAELFTIESRFYLKNIGDGKLLVDGKLVEQILLNDGAIITLGLISIVVRILDGTEISIASYNEHDLDQNQTYVDFRGFRGRPREIQSQGKALRPDETSSFSESQNEPFHRVTVLFGTDRHLVNETESFGSDYGILTYGSCDVSIPFNHTYGEMESPWFASFGRNPNPLRHISLLSMQHFSKSTFLGHIKQRIGGQHNKQLLLFVHGFNVNFEDAARRTGQLAYDLQFSGIPMFYSWPATGNIDPGYRRDSDRQPESLPKFLEFLRTVLENEEVQEAFVIGHSMGTRLLVSGIAELGASDPKLRAKLSEIILAAPDINAEVFHTQLAPKLSPPDNNVTIYSSSNDKALWISKSFNTSQRLGYTSNNNAVVYPGIDTIDVTEIDTDWLGHSRFGDTPTLVTDIKWLFSERTRAPRFNQEERFNSKGLKYWFFRR